jgi:hypothetical protein
VFTRIRHWTLFWARWIQFTPSHPTSLRSFLPLDLSYGLLHVFRPKNKTILLISPILATCPAHLMLRDLINQVIIGKKYELWSSSLSMSKRYICKNGTFWHCLPYKFALLSFITHFFTCSRNYVLSLGLYQWTLRSRLIVIITQKMEIPAFHSHHLYLLRSLPNILSL